MNVTFISTRYSVTFPLLMTTCWLLTHAPVIPRRVLSARLMPDFTASSKPFFDDDWISVILAMAITSSPEWLVRSATWVLSRSGIALLHGRPGFLPRRW